MKRAILSWSNKVDCACEEISRAAAVRGVVGWLTHPKVLDALTKKSDVSIVVHTEEFLDPETERGRWAAELRELYEKLNLRHLEHFHKFLVFYEFRKKRWWCSKKTLLPARVWCGSVDFTKNSENRLDSAVIVKNPKIVDAFAKEFERLWREATPLKT